MVRTITKFKDPNLTRPRILLVVRMIIINNGKILLIQRSGEESNNPLRWEIPGGKLDKGQDLTQAATREMIEEVGLFAIPVKQLVFFDSDISSNNKYKGIPYIQLAGLYASEGNKVRISKEHEDYKWVTLNNSLKLDLTEFTRKALLAWEVDIMRFLSKKK